MIAAQLSKLAALRAKTDRDLVSILNSALETARQTPQRRRAREIYAQVSMVLPKLENLSARRKLEIDLEMLRANVEFEPSLAAGSCV